KSGNVGRCRDREMFFSLAFYLILLLTHCFVCLGFGCFSFACSKPMKGCLKSFMLIKLTN
ncbi:hypothetical protein RGC27_05025, partial [Helicobacter pylori]|uniref:hypothetical protein n=1 Tax=Helicobacter pylori TaxID=210 RepID=UPI0029292BF5